MLTKDKIPIENTIQKNLKKLSKKEVMEKWVDIWEKRNRKKEKTP